jgi:hypothetical protein
VVDAAKGNADVFIKLNTPSAGTHVLTVQPGKIIEIVIQNDRAGYLGGEYTSGDKLTSGRNGREQHSFHLHGYHFWQVGGMRMSFKEPGILCALLQDLVCIRSRLDPTEGPAHAGP